MPAIIAGARRRFDSVFYPGGGCPRLAGRLDLPGYATGIAIVLFILFGLGMAAVTLLFVGMGAGPADQF